MNIVRLTQVQCKTQLSKLCSNILILKRFRTHTHQEVHLSVLLKETVDSLRIKSDGIYVDGTFGAGGHTSAVLNQSPTCKVYAFDRDPAAFKVYEKTIERYKGRLVPIYGNFGDMEKLLLPQGIKKVDGVMLDLGMSATQLDNPERGFSFRKTHDGPLDMRMDTKNGFTAADVVNNFSVEELADIIETYGEDKAAYQLANAIVRERENNGPIKNTGQLAHIIRKAMPFPESFKKDPATRTFQALRIFVNNEFEEIDKALVAAEHILVPGGRFSVITFHSLEDKRVMDFMEHSCTAKKSKTGEQIAPTFSRIQDKEEKGVIATESELARNPRARSAKLRVFERTYAPSLK